MQSSIERSKSSPLTHPMRRWQISGSYHSVERARGTKRVCRRPGINFRDAYPKRRDGQSAPKHYVRNTPVREAGRHQECFRRGPIPAVSADSFNDLSSEKTARSTRTKKLYLMMA